MGTKHCSAETITEIREMHSEGRSHRELVF